MTTNEPLTLIEKMIAFAEEVERDAAGPNAYEIVEDMLERLQHDPDYPDYYRAVLDKALNIVEDDCDTQDSDVLIACLEQLLDDMDDAEENENE
jgi:hypothetical protein